TGRPPIPSSAFKLTASEYPPLQNVGQHTSPRRATAPCVRGGYKSPSRVAKAATLGRPVHRHWPAHMKADNGVFIHEYPLISCSYPPKRERCEKTGMALEILLDRSRITRRLKRETTIAGTTRAGVLTREAARNDPRD